MKIKRKNLKGCKGGSKKEMDEIMEVGRDGKIKQGQGEGRKEEEAKQKIEEIKKGKRKGQGR